MKKILVTIESEADVRQVIEEKLSGLAEVSYLDDMSGTDRAAALRAAEIVLVMGLGKELAPAEYSLVAKAELLQSVPAGVDMVPLAELPQEPIVCANSGGWAAPFGEYALGLMLALGKELAVHSRRLAQGEYKRGEVRYFWGQTAGIIGFGGIGQVVARAVAGIGMKVMALNSRGVTDKQVDFIGTLADLDKVLKASDAVFLAIPLTRENHGLISSRELGLMKEDAIMINLARGAVVDEDALYEHLKSHPEFKFGSDVWWREPLNGRDYSLKHPIFDFPNVLGTPHNADLVEGIMPQAVGSAVDNIISFLEDRPLKGVVDRGEYI